MGVDGEIRGDGFIRRDVGYGQWIGRASVIAAPAVKW